jgi:hypothetical protein
MYSKDLIGNVGPAAAATGQLEALFLAGSLGKGGGDAWSDVDLLGVAPADRHEAIIAWWCDWLEEQEHLIYCKRPPWGGTLINAITQSWLRVDLILVTAGQMGRRAQDNVTALHDPNGLFATLPKSLPAHMPGARKVEDLAIEFIRMLGLLPVALGRGEWVTMVLGVGMLRDLITQLMLEEVPLADKGGILHLSTLLPQADMDVLLGLPYPGPEREGLIEANLRHARVFFPRARRLAAAVGATWPDEFEAVTRDYLAGQLGQAAGDLW